MSSRLAFSIEVSLFQSPRMNTGPDLYRAVAGNRLVVKKPEWKPAATGIVVNHQDFPIRDNSAAAATTDISPADLVDIHTRRRNQRAKVYERIYAKCCQRIKYSNDILYLKNCVFRVPEVQLWGGIPRYQVNAVIAYIMLRLKQRGFNVRSVPPDGVWVDWSNAVGIEGEQKLREQNTIRYELDETKTTVDPITTSRDRLLHEGCKGDCCVGPGALKPRRINMKEKLELERRKRQEEIDRVIMMKETQTR